MFEAFVYGALVIQAVGDNLRNFKKFPLKHLHFLKHDVIVYRITNVDY